MKTLIAAVLFTSVLFATDKQAVKQPDFFISNAVRWFVGLFDFSQNNQDSLKFEKFRPVIRKLISKGADSAFVYQMIADTRTRFKEGYARISVYRSPSGMREYTLENRSGKYADNFNNYSIGKSKEFIKNNLLSLSKAEAKYKVPKEVITSILWIETRHGSFMGDNHIISVYASLAMADQPEIVKMNRKAMLEKYSASKSEIPDLEKKLKERTEEKAEWAVEQLLALEKMRRTSPYDVFSLQGSWAGAFGMSQFIPTSYISWAVDGNGDGKVNLYDVDDAVFSVANYLKVNGWGTTVKEQRSAVFHYNRSNEYVDAVLVLAGKLAPRD